MHISLSFSLFLSIAVGVFITLFCIYLLKPVAIHIGLVDTPGGRKTHAHAVPLIGGVSIFFGFCFSLLCLNISLSDYRGLLAGSAILVLLGVIDDFRELTPRVRLAGQCTATLLLIEWGHISVDHLGNLFFFGNVNLGIFSFIATMIIVPGFINAINMIDGHDGLAGLIVLGQALLLIFLNLCLYKIENVILLLIFIVVLCVFLSFNLPLFRHKRASVFMGDAGSTFLGFVIAWFAVGLSQTLSSLPHLNVNFNLVTILWVLAYPLYDLMAVVLHRLTTKRSPFIASRDHLHYLLLDIGLRRSMVTFVIFAFSLLLGLFGLLLATQNMSESWQFVSFWMLFVLYFWTTMRLQKKISMVFV